MKPTPPTLQKTTTTQQQGKRKEREENITVSDSKLTTSLANKLTTIEAIILLGLKQSVKRAKIETTKHALKKEAKRQKGEEVEDEEEETDKDRQAKDHNDIKAHAQVSNGYK